MEQAAVLLQAQLVPCHPITPCVLLRRIRVSAGPGWPPSCGPAAPEYSQHVESESDEQPDVSSQVPESPAVAESPPSPHAAAEPPPGQHISLAQRLFCEAAPERSTGTAAAQDASDPTAVQSASDIGAVQCATVTAAVQQATGTPAAQQAPVHLQRPLAQRVAPPPQAKLPRGALLPRRAQGLPAGGSLLLTH